MSGYDVFDDPYCYKGTSVLKNRARLRDAKTLDDFELEMSTLRSQEPLPDGRFTPAHYRRVHHHLFQDVYSWAGKYRTVRTAKGGNWFCYPEHIASSTDQLFKKLALPVFKPGVSAADFLDAATDFLAELNAIHPFREGNGRSQLSFLHLVGQRAGHPLLLARIHHHILPDVFWRATNDARSPVGGILPAPWSKESTLSYMDDAGIDVAITSISTPGVHMGDDTAARDLAQRVNEISAELIQDRPDRFGGFAALPLPDVDGALRALEYGLDILKLDGIVLFSNARGIYLGDTRFRPLFDELERRKAVVFVHPTASPDAAARSLGLPDSLIDFTADTTRVVAQMHYGNTFARTPNVKYIFSHAGGTIPYLATRFSIVDEMNVIPGAEERGSAADTLRRLYWDTALSWKPPVLRMLRSAVGMDQVLFGSDYPYLRRDLAVACRQEVSTSAELNPEEGRAVLAQNALKLFPRLAQLQQDVKHLAPAHTPPIAAAGERRAKEP